MDFYAEIVEQSSGSVASGYEGKEGTVSFTIIWSDDSPAWNFYTCIGGRQMFHIVSKAKCLNDDQLKINKELLIGMGFNTTNFHYMAY